MHMRIHKHGKREREKKERERDEHAMLYIIIEYIVLFYLEALQLLSTCF